MAHIPRSCTTWLPYLAAFHTYGADFVWPGMRCVGGPVPQDQIYCTKCHQLHAACVRAICDKLKGKLVTWSPHPTKPLCKVMHVSDEPTGVLLTQETTSRTHSRKHLTKIARRLRMTMPCNNAACNHMPSLEKATWLVFDFCHRTARFRGWLCNRCNLALGSFHDDGATIDRAREVL